MKFRFVCLAILLLPVMISPSEAACRCQCVGGTMTSVCTNAMMDAPVTCTPTPCRANQPAAGQQPSANTTSKGKCREERVCDFYGSCRIERICN